MSQGDHLGSDPVEVMPYDLRWPMMFEKERMRIEVALGSLVEEVEHIGSTAVPYLDAKPIIDIMVRVRDLREAPACIEALRNIGYEYVPEFEVDLPNRRYFRKFDAEGVRTHQIHLVYRTDHEWWNRHILFRDYLRANPETAAEYGRLKQDLSTRFRHDREAYMDGKAESVRLIESRAISRKPGAES